MTHSINKAAAAATVFVLFAAVPALAADGDEGASAIAPCIELAYETRASAWLCTPAGLTVFTNDEQGGMTSEFTAVEPAVPALWESSEPSVLYDDYDGWCENGSVCHREISFYIEETKGNAAYGNAAGVIGTFDVILRTSLNGRQPQFRISLIWDQGPTLHFGGVAASCFEVVDNWPDSHCGTEGAGAPTIGPGGWRWNSDTLFGNRLNDNSDYYGAVNGDFRAEGYNIPFAIGQLESTRFFCAPNTNCRF